MPRPLDSRRKVSSWQHRLIYRFQRQWLIAYLAVIILLNLVPLAWTAANLTWGLENSLIREHEQTWKQRFKKIKALAENGSTAEAIRALSAFVRDVPADQVRQTHGRLKVDALVLLSRLEVEEGSAKRALRAADLAASIDPKDYRAHLRRAQALWSLGKAELALEADAHSLAINPNQPRVVAGQMAFHVDEGRYAQAGEVFASYLEAVQTSRFAVGFAPDGRFGPGLATSAIAIVDGRSHRYQVAVPRNTATALRRHRVADLVVVPLESAGMTVRIDAITLRTASDFFAPQTSLPLDLSNFRSKSGPLGHPPIYRSRQSQEILILPALPLPDEELTSVELTMTLFRPIDRELALLAERTFRNLIDGEHGSLDWRSRVGPLEVL